MERAVKEENISALKLDLAKAASLVLADFRGISVKSDTGLRREFRAISCKYKVVKNTLLGLAVKGTPMEGIEKLLAGPTAIAYSFEDPAAPAKVATKVAKAEEKFIIKGGYFDGKALDVKGVEALSTCPAKTSCARLSLQLCSPCRRTSCGLPPPPSRTLPFSWPPANARWARRSRGRAQLFRFQPQK